MGECDAAAVAFSVGPQEVTRQELELMSLGRKQKTMAGSLLLSLYTYIESHFPKVRRADGLVSS